MKAFSVIALSLFPCSTPLFNTTRRHATQQQCIRRQRHRAVDPVPVLSTAAAVDPYQLERVVLAHQHLHDRPAAEGEERSRQHWK